MSYETLKHYCSIVAALYQNVTFLSWACPSPQRCGTCRKEMTFPPTEAPFGRKKAECNLCSLAISAVCCLFSMQYLSKVKQGKIEDTWCVLFLVPENLFALHYNDYCHYCYCTCTFVAVVLWTLIVSLGILCSDHSQGHPCSLTNLFTFHKFTLNWKIFWGGIIHKKTIIKTLAESRGLSLFIKCSPLCFFGCVYGPK